MRAGLGFESPRKVRLKEVINLHICIDSEKRNKLPCTCAREKMSKGRTGEVWDKALSRELCAGIDCPGKQDQSPGISRVGRDLVQTPTKALSSSLQSRETGKKRLNMRFEILFLLTERGHSMSWWYKSTRLCAGFLCILKFLEY